MKPEKSERNIAEELTQAAKEIKAHKEGKLHPKVVSNDIITARNNLELSQSQFAALLGVSKRTLEQWEQERRDPSQAAQRLIQIAIQRPDVLIELFEILINKLETIFQHNIMLLIFFQSSLLKLCIFLVNFMLELGKEDKTHWI